MRRGNRAKEILRIAVTDLHSHRSQRTARTVMKASFGVVRLSEMSVPLQDLLPLLARLSNDSGASVGLDELSRVDGRSKFHLQRLFRAGVGETPLQFSRRVRLQRAAALLLASDKSVLDVALDVGFESQEGFSRAFKARFGDAPTRFRTQQRALASVKNANARHVELAHRAAPCIGLFRRELNLQKSDLTIGEAEMSYEIAKKSFEETPFLYVRRQIEPERIAEALGEMFGAVYGHATKLGIPFAGPPTARYPSFGPGMITIEAGMPIAGSAESDGEIVLGTLAGGDVASTVHKGPYDSLSKAHQALEKWSVENGVQAAGAAWEVYVTDPGEVPDPSEWLTEVNLPLR